MKALIAAIFTVGVACTTDHPDHRSDVRRPAVPPTAATTAQPPAADSARRFVQQFYDWYVPLITGSRRVANYDSLARNEHHWFAPKLVAALQHDLAVQRRDSSADIASITADADPFVASQDPCARFEAGSVRALPDGFSVDVHPVCGGQRSAQPVLTVEVAHANAALQIRNFRRPDDSKSDLVAELNATR